MFVRAADIARWMGINIAAILTAIQPPETLDGAAPPAPSLNQRKDVGALDVRS